MPLQARLVTAGYSAIQAQAATGSVANGVIALGASQATATPLGADLNRVTGVAGGTGVILPPMNPGDEIEVINAGGAGALLVYPLVGGTINVLGLNAGYSVALATPSAFFQCVSPTIFAAQQSA